MLEKSDKSIEPDLATKMWGNLISVQENKLYFDGGTIYFLLIEDMEVLSRTVLQEDFPEVCRLKRILTMLVENKSTLLTLKKTF